MSRRFPELMLLTLLAVAGCGRTPPPADPCADGHCPCVFDSDCPLEHTCVDNVCVRIEDYLECLTNGARPEECNGRDDDCDGMTDEGLGERACERSQGLLTCAGTEVCGGAAGWVCDAPLPGVERCDGIDNDCNGVTDDPFVDLNGQYFGKENCGGCGVSCDVIIPDAAETECALEAEGPHCRVVLCPAGTFPDETRSTCLTLPDPLCQPCQEDDDCRGPGARCLDLGNDERACGRDCGPGSAWGVTCPVGFFCQDAQCFPTSGTCLCGPTVIGATRSCVIDTCDGFETCESTQTGFEWGTCDISAHRETCDGLDNDCDGLIDNGFLNPNTGRYESDLHCGVCNNDCTRRWVPEVDHAVGGCEVASGRPECHILQCTTETLGAQVFEWVNVNGAEDDGCECRRRQGNTTVDPPDLGTFEQLAQGVIDENCDGVDGVVGDAFFVRPNAAVGGDGSLARPFRAVGAALAAFPGSGKVYILVAEGVYREEVVLFEGVQLYGGYSDDFLRRDVLQLATILQSPVAPGVGAQGTVRASGLGLGATRTILAGFHVYGADAAGSAAAGTEGATSVAISAVNVGPNLVLQNNVVRGGRGGEGGRGSTGQTGFGRQQSTALDGQRGIDGRRVDGECNGTFVAGGSGGVNGTCPASSSARGGNTTCPTFDWNVSPIQGGQAEYTSAGSNGAGGFHRSFDQISGPGCSHVTESGFPTSIQTNNGGDGTDGADGAPGANGLGCRAAFGTVVGAVFAPWAANSGVGGTDGGGGGGGGAGGGTARFGNTFNDCPAHELGATGGGGGAGGCGGTGGAPGGSGGGSIGLLLVGPGAGPTLASNRFERGLGGRGGDGGFGGSGGRGGRGAFGGGPTSWSGADGGKGGDGGNGGDGGGGGGGCGGASYGVLAVRASGAGIATSNDFTVADNVSTGGPAGSGGNGTAGGRGANGGSSNVLVVSACGPGGICAAGLSCDANQLCFPSGP